MKNMFQKLALIVAIIAMPLVSMAQDLNISGNVSDKNGSPISGVSVIVKGTTIGTTTGSKGDYN